METSPLPVKGCKIRPILGAQGLRVGRDLYRATPTVTRDLGFSGLIRITAPFSRLLRHIRGCGGPILTRINPIVAFTIIDNFPKFRVYPSTNIGAIQATTYHDARTDGLTGQKIIPIQLRCVWYKNARMTRDSERRFCVVFFFVFFLFVCFLFFVFGLTAHATFQLSRG
jgi:hypothetical protein